MFLILKWDKLVLSSYGKTNKNSLGSSKTIGVILIDIWACFNAKYVKLHSHTGDRQAEWNRKPRNISKYTWDCSTWPRRHLRLMGERWTVQYWCWENHLKKKKRLGPYSPRINAKLIKDLHLKMKLYLLIRVLYADSGESYKSIKCNSTEKWAKDWSRYFIKDIK